MPSSKVSVLHRPVYGTGEAAALLGLRPDRARAWLDGYHRKGVRYPPVVREAHTGDDVVTWGEFVELGYLREYRHGIPAPIAIVVPSGQTFALAGDARRFVHKVAFGDDPAGDVVQLHPAGSVSPVLIDPLVRFGRPTVAGVATDRLWELYDAGETVERIVEGYDLAEDVVRTAVAYEGHRRSLAA